MRRIPEFEGLRGYLAMWVVFGHISACVSWRPPGPLLHDLAAATAVEVFIVLSGFAITLLLLDRKEAYGPFLVRRFLRLAPVYYVCLASAVVLIPIAFDALQKAPATPGVELRLTILEAARAQLFTHVAVHVTMLHGLLTSVVPHVGHSIIEPAWSVSVEWQFYLVAPLVVATFWRAQPRAAIALCCVFLAFRYFRLSGVGSLASHYAPFLLGIGSAHLWRRLRDGALSVDLRGLRGLSLAAWLVSILILRRSPLALTVWFAALHASFAAAADHRELPKFEGLLSWAMRGRFSQWLGARSYGIYLGHMLVLYPCLWVMVRLAPSPTVFALGMVLGVSVGTLALASALHSWVEQPGLQFGRRLGKRLAVRWPAASADTMPSAQTLPSPPSEPRRARADAAL